MTTVGESALAAALNRLTGTWVELRSTVRDVPEGDGPLLVEQIGDEIEDGLSGLLEALSTLRHSIDDPDDLREAGAALGAVHERVARLSRAYWERLASLDRRRELRSLGRRRGGEWALWVTTLEDGLDRVPECLVVVDEELRRAWGELVERAASSAISLTANSIGQQISVTRERHAQTSA